MLRKRVLSSIIGIPPLIAIVWLGNPWFSILLGAAALVAASEFYRMVASSGRLSLTWLGIGGAVLFVLTPLCPDPRALPVLLAIAIIATLVGTACRARHGGSLADWAWTLGGMLYIGWLLSYFSSLSQLEAGWKWVILALFTVFAADTAAYFGGRAWGRHSLAPQISPGKTQEGAIAALLGAIVAAAVLPPILGLACPWWQALPLGFLVGIFSQLGDLAESALKRGCGVKDSGGLVPGHGGVLDRLDSLLFTGIIVYYYVIWVI